MGRDPRQRKLGSQVYTSGWAQIQELGDVDLRLAVVLLKASHLHVEVPETSALPSL